MQHKQFYKQQKCRYCKTANTMIRTTSSVDHKYMQCMQLGYIYYLIELYCIYNRRRENGISKSPYMKNTGFSPVCLHYFYNAKQVRAILVYQFHREVFTQTNAFCFTFNLQQWLMINVIDTFYIMLATAKYAQLVNIDLTQKLCITFQVILQFF